MSSSQGTCEKQAFQKTYECQLCSLVFIHKNKLRKHLACLHLDPYVYKCLECNYFSQSRHETEMHYRQANHGGKYLRVVKNNIFCEFCSIHYPTTGELARHIHQRHSAELQCPACEGDQFFLTKKTLKSHFFSKHGESLWGSYLCTTYKEAYHRVQKLKVDPHTGEYCCYICNRNSYTKRLVLFRHVNVHLDLYPFCCPDCPYISGTRSSALNHHARVHPNSKHKVINIFEKWDHELGIAARKKYLEGDTPLQESTDHQGDIFPQLKQQTNSRKEKRVPNQCKKSSQYASVQNLAYKDTIEKKNNKLDISELQNIEVHSMELTKIPEKDKDKKAKLDMIEHKRKQPHATKLSCFCCLCGSQFTSYTEFYTHTLTHEEKTVYRCSTCSYTSIGMIQIRRHVKLKHKTQGKISIKLVPVDSTCKTCDDLRSNKEELQIHISRAHDVGIDCPLCQGYFENIPLLKEHFALDHRTELWVSHVATVYEKLREKICFLQPNSSNRFTCFYCDIAFLETSTLFQHIGKVHLKWCPAAPQRNIQQGTDSKIQPNKRVKGSFACHICTSRYSKKARLLCHLREHRALNISLPYFCKTCGAFFAHRNSMEVHWYQNHGKSEVRFTRICRNAYFQVSSISNFPCRYCNLYRSSEDDRSIHESEKHAENYKCSGCNFACEKIDTMKIHITVVHAKSDPKPSVIRRKLCPIYTINTGEIASQSSTQDEASFTPNLVANHHDIKSNLIEMEPENSNLMNFEFVGCNPILKKPRTKKDSLNVPQRNQGFGLNVPATLVRKDQNVSLRESPGFNSQLTEPKSPTLAQGETGRAYPSTKTNPHPAKSPSTATSSEAHSPPPLVIKISMHDSTASITYTPVQGSVPQTRILKNGNRVVLCSPIAPPESIIPKVKEEEETFIPLTSQTEKPSAQYDSAIHSDLVSSDSEIRTGIGNVASRTKTVSVSLTGEADLKCEDVHNSGNQFDNIKEEMDFEETFIMQETEDLSSTGDSITNPFQVQALPYHTEVQSIKTEDESPESKIMDWSTSQCSSFTDSNGVKVKALPIPGTSYKRRVTSRPYPDSLPPVPGGCLPCSVQL